MAKKLISRKLQRLLKKQVLFPQEAVLVAACSGGADSLAMTSLLQSVGCENNWQIFVCHVQHHLRQEEAERDALFVEKFCQERQLPFRRIDVDVLALAGRERISTEEAARKLRYQALKEFCQEVGAIAIVTGHHQDDQAETVLLNLLRGAGTQGIRGMLVRNGLIVRPFLGATRAEMEEYCLEQNITWCVDSSNESMEYRRNKIRKELLPILEEYNPQIKRALATTAYLAAQDQECLDDLADAYLESYLKKTATGWCLAMNEFKTLPPALATRVLKMAIAKTVGESYCELGSKHVQALMQLVTMARSGRSLDLPAVKVLYAYDLLTITRQENLEVAVKFALPLSLPGSVRLPDGRLLSVSIIAGEEPLAAKNEAVYPRPLVTDIIEVRTRRSGDYYRPKGLPGGKKLKDYLIDKKLPRAERDSLVLVCAGQEVLWIVGKRAAGWKNYTSSGEWLLFKISEGGQENA